MKKPTQLQLYYQEQRKIADRDILMAELLKSDPPTKSEFDELLKKRPHIYSRYKAFRDELPDSRSK